MDQPLGADRLVVKGGPLGSEEAEVAVRGMADVVGCGAVAGVLIVTCLALAVAVLAALTILLATHGGAVSLSPVAALSYGPGLGIPARTRPTFPSVSYGRTTRGPGSPARPADGVLCWWCGRRCAPGAARAVYAASPGAS